MLKIIFYIFLLGVVIWAVSWSYICDNNEEGEKVCSFSGVVNITEAPKLVKDGFNNIWKSLNNEEDNEDDNEDDSDEETNPEKKDTES